MPEEGGQSEPVGGGGGGGLMTGNRGWIIVLAVVILEAAFFIVLLKFKSEKTPADTNVGGGDLAEQTMEDFIKDKIPLDKLSYSIPMPSGQPMTLAMDLVLVMGRTDTEIREKIMLTGPDWDKFREAVTSMVPWIKDQLNRTVNKMSASELSTDRGQQQIRDIVRERVNTKLNSMKWEKLSNPKISKDRITDVWITNWYFN